ncbi:unnamed protein product, partial [Staurois parvus]
ISGKSRRLHLCHVISCVQSQLITWGIYTDHQGTVSAAYQCSSVLPVSAHQCHLTVPVTAAYECHI